MWVKRMGFALLFLSFLVCPVYLPSTGVAHHFVRCLLIHIIFLLTKKEKDIGHEFPILVFCDVCQFIPQFFSLDIGLSSPMLWISYLQIRLHQG